MRHDVLGVEARQDVVGHHLVGDDEHEPRQPCCHDGHEDPLHVVGCIAAVGQVVAVVVMGAMLAAVAVLRTVVFVLVPAGLVHGMLALHHNLVARLKRLFAVVARLAHHSRGDTHVATGIADDVLMQEVAIANEGYDELQQQPHDEGDDEGQQQAADNDDGDGMAVNDDGAVEAALADGGGERGDKAVALSIGKADVQRLVVAAIHLAVRVLKDKLVGVRTDVEVAENGILEVSTAVGLHVETLRSATEVAEDSSILAIANLSRLTNAGVEGLEVRCVVGIVADQLVLEEIVVGVDGHVRLVVIHLTIREDEEHHPLGIRPRFQVTRHLALFLQDGAVEIDKTLVGALEVVIDDVVRKHHRTYTLLIIIQ